MIDERERERESRGYCGGNAFIPLDFAEFRYFLVVFSNTRCRRAFLLSSWPRKYGSIYILYFIYIYIYYIEVGPKARNSPVNWLVCEIDDRSGKSVRSFLRQLVPCLAGTTPRGGEKKIELEGEVFARRNGEKELERGGRKRSGVRPPSWVSGNKSRCYIYMYIHI